MKVHSIVNLHFILGSHCGVDRSSIPEDDQPFLITGSPCLILDFLVNHTGLVLNALFRIFRFPKQVS